MSCSMCGMSTINDHDACIADLPGVIYACCGHGGRVCMDGQGDGLDNCYLMFDDDLILRGNAARAAMEMLGGTPLAPPPGTRSAGVIMDYANEWPEVETEIPEGCTAVLETIYVDENTGEEIPIDRSWSYWSGVTTQIREIQRDMKEVLSAG